MISIEVDGVAQTVAAFTEVEGAITDLRKHRIWFRVRQAFYKVQKDIFGSEGPGWQALSPKYAAYKNKRWGGKPILQASGKMFKEFTQSAGSVDEQADEMTMGFSSPAPFHMGKGARSKMPYRSSLDLNESQQRDVLEPIGFGLKQVADNVKLLEKRGF